VLTDRVSSPAFIKYILHRTCTHTTKGTNNAHSAANPVAIAAAIGMAASRRVLGSIQAA